MCCQCTARRTDLTGRCDAAGKLALGSAPPPADAGALAAQVRCLARRPLLEPLVALVVPAACAADAARPAAPAPANAWLANGSGSHGSADMDMDAPAASGSSASAASAGARETARGAPGRGTDSGFVRAVAGQAQGLRGGAPDAAAPVRAGPEAGLAMAGEARALCALLAAVLDAEALQSDALHTLGAQLVGRLWFSHLRVRCRARSQGSWQPSAHVSMRLLYYSQLCLHLPSLCKVPCSQAGRSPIVSHCARYMFFIMRGASCALQIRKRFHI